MNKFELTADKFFIFLGGIIAIVAIFFPWIDLFFMSANGFQIKGYLALIAFIYPTYVALKQKKINKKIPMILIAIEVLILFIITSSGDALAGVYWMIIALVVLSIGVLMTESK